MLAPRPVRLARTVVRWHAPLAWFAVLMVGSTAVAVVGLLVDDRTLLGARVWAKPAKFSVLLAVYAVTLAWMIGLLPRFRRTAWWTGTVVATAGLVEMTVILGQAARGRRSHFNGAPGLENTLYSIMGVTVAVLWTATLVVAVLVFRNRLPDPVATWAARLGAAVAMIGLSVGFLMVLATPVVDAGQAAAGPATPNGAHAVGVADGGPGLPLLGWSTTGGDLRIGHFVGMHALQALPLAAIALSGPLAARLTAAVRLRLVFVAAGAYTGVTLLVTWQALRGQPLLRPDTLTLGAWAALAVGTALAVGAACRPAVHPGPAIPVSV